MIDEITQFIEFEYMIPLIHECDHLILVEDNYQLESLISSKKVANIRIELSLFERLVLCDHTS